MIVITDERVYLPSSRSHLIAGYVLQVCNHNSGVNRSDTPLRFQCHGNVCKIFHTCAILVSKTTSAAIENSSVLNRYASEC